MPSQPLSSEPMNAEFRIQNFHDIAVWSNDISKLIFAYAGLIFQEDIVMLM